jgi:transcriptional regulator
VSLYQPPSFIPRDAGAAIRLMHEYPFATLIATGGEEPQISHLPLLYRAGSADAAPHGMLIGHMARANPHWKRFADAPSLAVFHGPHAYVSPSWYTTPATAVPTWNYAVVHVRGRVDLIEGGAATLATVQDLVARFESERASPWHLQLKGTQLDAMIGAIVAFQMTIERIDTKLKMSQNRVPADRDGVIAGLRNEPYPESAATAEWMATYAKES